MDKGLVGIRGKIKYHIIMGGMVGPMCLHSLDMRISGFFVCVYS